MCQELQCQGFNGDGRTTVRPYTRYSSAGSTTDAPIVRSYTRYTSTEEIGKRQGGNELSPRRAEIKVRKNEMKLRKKDFEVPKIFFIPRWRIPVFHR